jgi:hypothetical protein
LTALPTVVLTAVTGQTVDPPELFEPFPLELLDDEPDVEEVAGWGATPRSSNVAAADVAGRRRALGHVADGDGESGTGLPLVLGVGMTPATTIAPRRQPGERPRAGRGEIAVMSLKSRRGGGISPRS